MSKRLSKPLLNSFEVIIHLQALSLSLTHSLSFPFILIIKVFVSSSEKIKILSRVIGGRAQSKWRN